MAAGVGRWRWRKEDMTKVGVKAKKYHQASLVEKKGGAISVASVRVSQLITNTNESNFVERLKYVMY